MKNTEVQIFKNFYPQNFFEKYAIAKLSKLEPFAWCHWIRNRLCYFCPNTDFSSLRFNLGHAVHGSLRALKGVLRFKKRILNAGTLLSITSAVVEYHNRKRIARLIPNHRIAKMVTMFME